MAFTNALYYPTIDIHDESWLKSAALYWDTIRTIVPVSIKDPYRNRTAKELFNAKILKSFSINSNSQVVSTVSAKAVEYLQSPEAQALYLSRKRSGLSARSYRIHQEKLPREFRVHQQKLPMVVRDMLREQVGDDGWLHADYAFASFYMTLLASAISESKGWALLSDNAMAEDVARKSQLDNNIAGRVDFYNMRGETRPIVRIGEALLTQLIVQGVRIHPRTSVEKILRFKSDHKPALGAFRTNVQKLASSVPDDVRMSALPQ